MAYIDSSPDGLMPAPIRVSRATAHTPPAPVAPRRAPADRRRLETIALAAIGLVFAGLAFALAMVTIASLGIALVVTALTLLPLASLMAAPSGSGRPPVRKRPDGAWS